jgi:ketol-acid reductoisomerase
VRVYRENDVKQNDLKTASVAVIGYGNQGRAHALNLRDSGVAVTVGARKAGGGWKRAVTDGFEPLPTREAVSDADVVAILVPDEAQHRVFDEEIAPHLKSEAALVFAHGFAVAFGLIPPPAGHDVLLVAPKGQGDYLRKLYRQGLPCLVAVERDVSGRALDRALSYAAGLGCLRAGAIETTFREEAITDLFGEQVVLCGGVPALVTAAFETLVANGYRPEIAYLECLHELQIITDLMQQGGVAGMRAKISRTAAWGSFGAADRIVTEKTRESMATLLRSIESGEFAEGWRREANDGQKRLNEMIDREARHSIEQAGRSVRELMPYLKKEDV